MKKLLLLGGSNQQVIAIETAKRLGYYTILCDYLPDNPGQYSADKFYLVSTTDKDAILKVAQTEKINGVIAYASDPAAPTAAYVAEQLGLPTNPYDSVKILCNKDMFRGFLKNNGFNAPEARGYDTIEKALCGIPKFRLPVIVKPVDSSGSKGVTMLRSYDGMERALSAAFSFSKTHRIVVEEFVEKKHPYLIGGDIFVKDGKVVMWGLMNCHRDSGVNPLVPVGKSFPLELEGSDIENVKQTLQKIVDRLQIRFGAMNVELIVDYEGKVWPIDIGPRSGGNKIPELMGLIFDTDVVEMSVKAAMGEDVGSIAHHSTPYYASYNLHAVQDGFFKKIIFSKKVEANLINVWLYKRKGDRVEYFDNASKAIGIVFLKFNSQKEMSDKMEHMQDLVKVIVEDEKIRGGAVEL